MLHKLLHASELIPFGRQLLYYLRKAVKDAKHRGSAAARLGHRATGELDWWSQQLRDGASHRMPLAARYTFPASSGTTLVSYGDASRELLVGGEARVEEVTAHRHNGSRIGGGDERSNRVGKAGGLGLHEREGLDRLAHVEDDVVARGRG